MCNACGFRCCGYDGFSKCGCDWCDEPECWDDEPDDSDEDDMDRDWDCSCLARPTAFVCEAVQGGSDAA